MPEHPQPHETPLPFTPAILVEEQDGATHRWHSDAGNRQDLDVPADLSPREIAQRLHAANFTLWHLEDEARDPNATDRTIVQCKRFIDRTNQQRNNLVERLDESLLDRLQQNGTAPLHSETPGQIVDRLSILSLKIYHTHEEAERATASAEHRERNRQRLRILTEQRDDLRDALTLLFHNIADGKVRFRLYRQMKMYNDPDLNPVLYAASERSSKTAS
ncbi:hypothetical protein Terro_1427 [Terriglobus roseus DSM 18391]|uniref:DUF4254 domain-containing protein n=1 Tax=Terriglobus roseus (strain DSM 18391 / NRRL B-41598 / KBS 63) TaxID=926566 RepID=I3ZER8_TERRK|nr:DUF4254 domain-containing protein [Terriglobus roseus]AFL87736.1 hypothetical protein Terro_1427 [Terriglobus roseus DSM 18391]